MHRRSIRRFTVLIALSALIASMVGTVATTASAADAARLSPRDKFLKDLLDGPRGMGLSSAARTLIEQHLDGGGPRPGEEAPRRMAPLAAPLPLAGAPTNTRVNDPVGDGEGDPNMTTQSETSLAVDGSNIVVGYNDDGHTSLNFNAGEGLTGYSYSSDGGTTWTDSSIPNPPQMFAGGDPSVTVDSNGVFYMASLGFGWDAAPILISKSTDGGATFGSTVQLDGLSRWSFNDKPWITSGPNPLNPTQDRIYAIWTDFGWDTTMVYTMSEDGGVTWSPTQPIQSSGSFSTKASRGYDFVQGGAIAADPSGRVYVAWERFVSYDDTQGWTREIWSRSATDGVTFKKARKIATIRSVGAEDGPCGDSFVFGPSEFARAQEFPTLSVGLGDTVFATYNGTKATGESAVFVSTSVDHGHSWTKTRLVTTPLQDAFMPSVAADGSGVTVIYYERTSPTTLKVRRADSPDGTTWAYDDLSSTDFGVPPTFFNFDPLIAPCYMGDYIGVTRSGGTNYAAWGDNRDTLVAPFFPSGRPDPNIYFGSW